MKKILLSVLISALLFSASIFSFSMVASAEKSTKASDVQNTTAVSTQITAERTDDDPFAESNPSIEEQTPTYYYILAGVAGVIIIFAIAGFVTSQKKK